RAAAEHGRVPASHRRRAGAAPGQLARPAARGRRQVRRRDPEGRGRGRRDRTEREDASATDSPRDDTPPKEDKAATQASEKPRKERAKRDYKRKDDDPILDPAPDEVRGFGDDVPAFLR
ncbi:MAG: hypothetical protein VXW22_06265, partial [Pseudomonadota bacterium]|nr:hypothetical protein [Pseudomonadota bacterium]